MLLDVSTVSSGYGGATILQALSLHISAGEAVALLGRNGAGKSTTLKTIMGLVKARSGSISFQGRDITTLPTYRIARSGIGYVPEDRRIFTDLSVMENLLTGQKPSLNESEAPWTPERIFDLFPNLGAMRSRLGGRMSGGEQQMLSIARTLMGNPTLLLLDEPSEGLAPKLVETMGHAILNLKQAGLSIILSEQNPNFTAQITDRAYIIERGETAYSGTMKELMTSEGLREKYLAL